MSQHLMRASRACLPRQTATLLPFLYQTRSIQDYPVSSSQWHRGPQRTVATPSAQSLKPEEAPLDNDLDLDRPPLATRGNSTITPSERQTFLRIFNEIIASATHSQDSPSNTASTLPHPSHVGRESGFAAPLNGGSRASGAADENGLSFRPGETAPLESSRRASELYALSRYPEPLRAAAARASAIFRRRQQETVSSSSNDERQSGLVDPAERKREDQLNRVEALLRAAKSDVDIWSILNREVFSMVEGLDDVTSPGEGTSGKRKGRPPKQSRSLEAANEGFSNASPGEQSVPSLAIILSNYPHLLLLAARLLRHDFQRPSLCVALFAHIRALGPVSYVLGASTALYNDLIEVKWKDYAEFDGVDELLAEMDKGGVDFDERTRDLLEELGAERSLVSRGRRGEISKLVWQMEGLETGLTKALAWNEIVRERLMESAALETA